MEEHWCKLLAVICLIFLQTEDLAEGIQCYSCKAHSSNEVDANIRCLEQAHLENCDDFYDYYNEVEDQSVLSYEYYYYEQEAEAESEADDVRAAQAQKPPGDDGQSKRPKRPKRQVPRRVGPGPGPPPGFRASEEDARREEYERRQDPRRRGPVFRDNRESERHENHENQKRRQPPPRDRAGPTFLKPENVKEEEREFERRQRPTRPEPDEERMPDSDIFETSIKEDREEKDSDNDATGDDNGDADDDDDDGHDEDAHDVEDNKTTDDVEYEYYDDYEYVDYEYPVTEPPTTTTTKLPQTTDLATTTTKQSKSKPTMPRDPEHYCYSSTKKDEWESYTVEKGCKKIRFCKEHLENLPDWGNPWNFCCDKSRCNAKLVKDKPQRIFGMKCRRTDDCIQGHNSRPVCPSHFRSCPRISSSMIKMECRVKDRTMDSVKNSARYQNAFKEKKCYCRGGSFPRGPICTNVSDRLLSWTYTLSTLGVVLFVTLCLHH